MVYPIMSKPLALRITKDEIILQTGSMFMQEIRIERSALAEIVKAVQEDIRENDDNQTFRSSVQEANDCLYHFAGEVPFTQCCLPSGHKGDHRIAQPPIPKNNF